MTLTQLRIGSTYAARERYESGPVRKAVFIGIDTTTRCDRTPFGQKTVTVKAPVFAHEEEGEWKVLETKAKWTIPWAEYEELLDQIALVQRENESRRRVVDARIQSVLDALGIKPVEINRRSWVSLETYPNVSIHSESATDNCGHVVYTFDPDRSTITLTLGQLEALTATRKGNLRVGKARPAFES